LQLFIPESVGAFLGEDDEVLFFTVSKVFYFEEVFMSAVMTKHLFNTLFSIVHYDAVRMKAYYHRRLILVDVTVNIVVS